MRPLIIRDDDTSYFTPFEKLEAIYGALWSQRFTALEELAEPA